MSSILTPVSLWKNFNDKLDVMPVTLGEKVVDGVKFEYLYFSGRDTGMGRVTIYGVLASKESAPSRECVLLLLDSRDEVNEELLAHFVKCGYSALYVDYAGEREGHERFTQYPINVKYANVEDCGRYKDYVDFSADRTCWYEWVAVGIYARKLLSEKFETEDIGLVGLRDGGEIAWKLAYASQFSCAVTINACGWAAYKGIDKFSGKEPLFDEERYRFAAAIDSQAYAPYVRCPVLMLNGTCDPGFNYDRAYDTFARINPEFARKSTFSYSVGCGTNIDARSTGDMFMFLDSFVKDRHVFIPKPLEVKIFADEEENLVAKVSCDSMGIIEKCGVFFSEDSFDFSQRDWSAARLKKSSGDEREFYLDVYEKTESLFVLCYAVYSNGFTVWSKLVRKKISGNFANGRAKSNIVYITAFGTECFSPSDCSSVAVGGTFLLDDSPLPKIISECGLEGIYSPYGLITNRITTRQYSPRKDSILKFDVCSDEDISLDVSLVNRADGQVYRVKLYILGGVWQSSDIKAKMFKNSSGVSLVSFTDCISLTVNGSGKFAFNNLIWL